MHIQLERKARDLEFQCVEGYLRLHRRRPDHVDYTIYKHSHTWPFRKSRYLAPHACRDEFDKVVNGIRRICSIYIQSSNLLLILPGTLTTWVTFTRNLAHSFVLTIVLPSCNNPISNFSVFFIVFLQAAFFFKIHTYMYRSIVMLSYVQALL